MKEYLIRTPTHRGVPLGSKIIGFRRTRKRDAVSLAKFCARAWANEPGGPRARRVSVYAIEGGKRPSLLFQCHHSRKLGRIVVEEL